MRTSLLSAAVLFFSTAAAFGAHPKPYVDTSLPNLAHELEEASRHVYVEARRARHHWDRGERHGLKALRRLDREARHFHRQVERYDQDPYHTLADYYELREAYHRAAAGMHSLHGVAHVRHDFARVSRLVWRLDRYFESDRRRRYDSAVPRHRDDHGERDRFRFFFQGWWR